MGSRHPATEGNDIKPNRCDAQEEVTVEGKPPILSAALFDVEKKRFTYDCPANTQNFVTVANSPSFLYEEDGSTSRIVLAIHSYIDWTITYSDETVDFQYSAAIGGGSGPDDTFAGGNLYLNFDNQTANQKRVIIDVIVADADNEILTNTPY